MAHVLNALPKGGIDELVSLERYGGFAGLVAGVGVSAQPQDNVAGPAKDWPVVGGDLTNARYSTLDQINTQTVKDLGAARMRIFEQGGASRATPVVQDGRLFITAGANHLCVQPEER